MTRSKRSVLVLLPVVLLVSACTTGAASRPEVQYTPVRTASTGGQASETAAGGWEGEAQGYGTVGSSTGDATLPAPAAETPASAPSQRSAGSTAQMMREAEPEPSHRPGLGTQFGEQRMSQIHYVSFVRGAASPFATVAVHYNDSQGIAAMVTHDMGRGATMSPMGVDPRGEITISVVDENGQPLPSMRVGGRVYVVGEAGRRYSISVRNNGSRRYEILASVDGLDVMDGQDASFEKRGYIVAPFQSFLIEGFRTSEADVAAFRFGSVRDSYAARTGSARNVGVIGVALFSELGVNYYDQNEIETRQSADPFPGRFATPPR